MPDTNETAYERLQLLLETEPLTQEEQRFLLRMAGQRAGWDDPAMDTYNEFDPQS